MRIARVFPRRTRATPDDALAFTGPPDMFPVDADAVHVSVAFTYDMPKAEALAKSWESVAPATIGGPGAGTRGEDFVPGRYLKPGYVITSRGCPNRCWFCTVPVRDGTTRELPITHGHDLLDDNLLACSEAHIKAVFAMLSHQKVRAKFTGGLEARRIMDWHIELLAALRPESVFLAYDTPDDWEPLAEVTPKLIAAGIAKGHRLRCYVLIGFRDDSMAAAQGRLDATMRIGLAPMPMLYRAQDAVKHDPEWRRLARHYARSAIAYAAGAASSPEGAGGSR